MTVTAGSIDKDFVVLSPSKTATIEIADSSLYERLESNYGGFEGYELISCYTFDKDWGSWEIHPHGDEIVILMKGEVTFVLELEAGNQNVHLDHAGAFVVVPRNTWHTAKTTCHTVALFVTPGQETKHREENA